MANLNIFGKEFANVAGFKIPDTNGNLVTYTEGGGSAVLGTKTISANGTYNASSDNLDGYSSVEIDVPSKNWQINNSNYRVGSTSYIDTGVSLTVAKTGTYNVYWSGFRNTTSGTSGSRLYINGTPYGTAQTTFQNSYIQTPKLTGVELEEGDEITIYARSRASNYYMCVGNLVIEQTA